MTAQSKLTKWIAQTVFLITLFFLQNAHAMPLIFPDFTTSMIREKPDQDLNDSEFKRRIRLYNSADPKFLDLFREKYEQNVHLALSEPEDCEYRIPPIVHQIWLGSKVPAHFYDWMQTWANMHGWEYWLWTDKDVKEMKLYNQDTYDMCTNPAEKADILRLEILNQYGGLYVDVDFECVCPDSFDRIHKLFDFYICFEPLEHDFINRFRIFKTCNAIIASRPQHPLINDLIINLKANYLAYRPHSWAVQCTGPNYISRIICEYELSGADQHRNMYFPSTFFYPFTEAELTDFKAHPKDPIKLFPETAAIHYWTGSWWRGNWYQACENDNEQE